MDVTIKDIAKAAGVSKSTVSRVISNAGNYSDEARRKVLEAAEKLNYRKNTIATAMKTKKTKTLGLIIYKEHKPILSHPFYAPIVEAIVDSSRKRGYSIIIATDQDVENSAADFLLEKRVDGIIFASFVNNTIIKKCRQIGLPLVLLNCSMDMDVSFVKADNYLGAYEAVAYLIKKKHREIGFLSGPLQNDCYYERYRGYLAALNDYNVPVRENLMRFGEPTFSEGARLMNSMLDSGHIPSAIFASCDMIAIGAIKAIKKAGLHIPNDVAIIGFEDIEYDVLIEPALSTVFVDKVKMGQMAVEVLLNEIVNKPNEKRENILPTKLIVRESS